VSACWLDRRGFLRAVTGVAIGALAPQSARAEESFTIGLVLPPASPASTALTQGATQGLDDANALATMFGKRLRLQAETARDAGAAAAIGRALARQAGALALVGGAGAGFADALRDVAAAEATLFMNAAAIDDALRGERCDRHVYHLAPSVTMRVDALALWLIGQRRLARWAIVGDGSPRAREIEAAARRALARHGGSLEAERAAEVFLLAFEDGALREAVLRARAEGRTAAIAGIGGEVAETLGVDEAAGIWAVGWHHELERFSARDLNSRFRRRFGAPLTEVSWAAWAAVKLIGEAVVRGGVANPVGLGAFFASSPPFDGHKGAALTFRPWDHQLRQPLYVIGLRRREQVGGRRGAFEVLADVPGANLDALGTGPLESRCREVTR
jgi:ABC transporter substrate binding protein (PQQ-dependent alcohol dehydrogenase system)